MSITYKLNVSSPWKLHRTLVWRWWPTRWQTGFASEVWWLCFRLERHVVGATAFEREVSPVPREGFEREAVQGATRYYEWARYTRRPELDCAYSQERS